MLLQLVIFLHDAHEILDCNLLRLSFISIEIFDECTVEIPTVPSVCVVCVKSFHGAKMQLIAIIPFDKECTWSSTRTVR